MFYSIQSASDGSGTPVPEGRCPASGGATVAASLLWDDVDYPVTSGTLSIKAAFGGTEHYHITGGPTFAVSDATYLVLNEGQEYGSSIEPGVPTNTFCIFFRRGMADEVLDAQVRSEDQLLDDPEGRVSGPVHFFEHLRRHDNLITPLLGQVHRRLTGGTITRLWLQERAHDLLHALLEEHRGTIRRIDRLPGERRSTRLERYRRVERGRAYIEAHFRTPLTLEEVARAAHLSPFHFLRLFRETLGQTPGQYITERRIEEARRLLRETDLPVGTICGDVGFESHGSFTTLFSRRVGLPPTLYRMSNFKCQMSNVKCQMSNKENKKIRFSLLPPSSFDI